MSGRFDAGLAPAGKLIVEVGGADSLKLEQLILAGGAVIRRNSVRVTDRGIPPVEILAVYSGTAKLVGAVGTLRNWAFPVQQLGDPEPGVALVAFDLNDVKTAFTGGDLDGFKTFFSSYTLDDLRVYDWGVLL